MELFLELSVNCITIHLLDGIKMFCLITPQIKDEVICFLLYLKSLWNLVLDFDIKLEFWFRNGWLTGKTKIKVDTHIIPFFILSNIFAISAKVAPGVFAPKISRQLFRRTQHATWANRKSKNVKGVAKCNHINLKWQRKKFTAQI